MELTYIDDLILKAKAAQQELETYTQEEVDRIVKTIGKTIYDNAELLAQEAVAESGYGRVDSKTWKQKKSCMAAWVYLRDKKSVGIIEEDPINQTVTYAKPVGVIACLSPSTNPTSTVASNGMSCVKARNAIIVTPHPRTKKCTLHGVTLINEALKAIKSPENLIQIIEEPTTTLSQELMSKCDVTIATGGTGMVKAAYSSGRPSYGVGQGNVQTIIADDYTDFANVASIVVSNRFYDNGMPCTCDQTVHIPRKYRDQILEEFQEAGAFIIEDNAKKDLLTQVLFKEDGTTNPRNVGMLAVDIAKRIDIEVPAETLILMAEASGVAKADLLCKEKLNPVLTFIAYDTFQEGVENARQNLLMEGAGHTVVVFTNERVSANYVGEKLPVSRVVVNQAGGTASGGNLCNGLKPTMSLGCGSWGNNSISENLTYRHLMNTTIVAYPIPDARFPTPEEVWGE